MDRNSLQILKQIIYVDFIQCWNGNERKSEVEIQIRAQWENYSDFTKKILKNS